MPHDKNWGWNHVIREDSVHWLVVADDLNRLNIRTGEVYAYEAKTGVTDVKGALLSGLMMVGAGVAGAMATGYAAYPAGVVGSNVINQLHSNVVLDDSLYFFADREHVACLDKERYGKRSGVMSSHQRLLAFPDLSAMTVRSICLIWVLA